MLSESEFLLGVSLFNKNRIYMETGRNAAFDRTLFGFLAFLHTSRDGEAEAGGA